MPDLDFEIPGYDILESIGKGGMASVYRARQHSFDRNVALKILRPDLSEDDAFCQRFVMESLIIAKLNHSHIVQVYDVGEVSNNYYIAMEFLSGGDLNSLLKERCLSTDEAVSIIKQMASALDFAHRKNIVHRDLKPDNVMFREDGAAVLTDFGIAKETDAGVNLTQTGLMVGTPKYMSPEQIRGAEPSPTGDIYSLGIMFFQLLTNRVPFSGKDIMATVYQHFDEPVPLLPSSLTHFQHLIERMLAKQVSDRIQTGSEVVQALEDLASTTPVNDETRIISKQRPIAHTDATVIKPKTDNHNPSISSYDPVNDAESIDPNIEATKKKNWIIAAGAAVGLALIITTVLLSTQNSSPHTQVLSIPDISIKSSEQHIEELLAQAQSLVTQGKLDTPMANNAFNKYQAVLALHPQHPEALAGIRSIAKQYRSQAEQAIIHGKLNTAQHYLDRAQIIDPGVSTSSQHQQLRAALTQRERPKAIILSAKQSMRIAGLLESAALDEKEGRLFSPVGENAAEKYQKVLEINSENTQARKQLERLNRLR